MTSPTNLLSKQHQCKMQTMTGKTITTTTDPPQEHHQKMALDISVKPYRLEPACACLLQKQQRRNDTLETHINASRSTRIHHAFVSALRQLRHHGHLAKQRLQFATTTTRCRSFVGNRSILRLSTCRHLRNKQEPRHRTRWPSRVACLRQQH